MSMAESLSNTSMLIVRLTILSQHDKAVSLLLLEVMALGRSNCCLLRFAAGEFLQVFCLLRHTSLSRWMFLLLSLLFSTLSGEVEQLSKVELVPIVTDCWRCHCHWLVKDKVRDLVATANLRDRG